MLILSCVCVCVCGCVFCTPIVMHNLSGVVSTTDAYQFGALTRRHLYPCVHVCSWVCVCGLMWKRARVRACVLSLSLKTKAKAGGQRPRRRIQRGAWPGRWETRVLAPQSTRAMAGCSVATPAPGRSDAPASHASCEVALARACAHMRSLCGE